jgi:crossover junction endodeoxyribonuclease RuvC
MIILGIDPGTTQIGYGFIEVKGSNLSCLAYGIIKNNGKDKIYDLKNTEKQLNRLIKKYKPSVASVEKLFFFKNQKTVISVSEMRGVILLTLVNNKLPIKEFTPLEVKKYVSNYGRASKDQVQTMVRLLLSIKKEIKPDDAADALAIAICCSTAI